MEFSRELRADVLSGAITVSFRLWSRPQVKAGGRYQVGTGQIEVDSMELVPFASIDADDVERSGEPDLESLRRRAGARRSHPRRHAALPDRVPRRAVATDNNAYQGRACRHLVIGPKPETVGTGRAECWLGQPTGFVARQSGISPVMGEVNSPSRRSD